jgi:glycosyltransferase involved in cell wall biosynthesis
VLRSATIVVLPSYSENFGVAALEAMAVGRPIVVTPEVGLADVVTSSGAGLVVEGDPKRMGEAIRQLLDDPARMREMGRRGERTVTDQFTWRHIAESMHHEYTRILGVRS